MSACDVSRRSGAERGAPVLRSQSLKLLARNTDGAGVQSAGALVAGGGLGWGVHKSIGAARSLVRSTVDSSLRMPIFLLGATCGTAGPALARAATTSAQNTP
eukprot:3796910-Rhodomonas_salina.1